MRSRRRRLLLLAATLGMALLLATAAFARVGGGHGYSGGHGGGHYGGGYSGGGHYGGGTYYGGSYGNGGSGGWIIFELIRLLVYLHVSALPVALIVDIGILYVISHLMRGAGDSRITSMSQVRGDLGASRREAAELASVRTRALIRQRLAQFQRIDANFSEVLFRDFASLLFTQIHHARGAHKLDDYADYVSPEAIEALKRAAPQVKKLESVIIGAETVIEVGEIDAPENSITVLFEANYTEGYSSGSDKTWYVREKWLFTRKRGVLSREPARIRVIACPNCGAPSTKASDGSCPSCGRVIRSGDFDWYVAMVELTREERPPMLTAAPHGRDPSLPTVYDPDLKPMLQAYAAEHLEFNQPQLMGRFARIFIALQKAWTDRDWEKARPYETDNLFQSHRYWMTEYRKQKLVNVLDQIQVSGIVPVKLRNDRFYTSLTVRIFGEMIDYTRTEDGRVVSGSTRSRLDFSEYWTFIKGRTAGAPKGDSETTCPQCGAPLKINMAGLCEYCQSKITSGDFDWVLSQIEQDESYVG